MSPSNDPAQWAATYPARVLAVIVTSFHSEPITDPDLTRWHFARNGALARAVLDAGAACRAETGAELSDDLWVTVRAVLGAAMAEPFAPEAVIQRMGRMLMDSHKDANP